ncbi:MAG: cyclic nucleotide-binding domain-containing protein [Gammaproteobacteria bacterium]|nr:cyclic nucleotide-binding domain-containing protein [Gammaproteobacteria bacterium]MDH3769198.1 cyclic nucleotide-binding domain-containing protein [Gammaproteobacteria bacterium]
MIQSSHALPDPEDMMPTALKSVEESVVGSELLDWLAESPIFEGLGQTALRAFAHGCELRSFDALDEAIVEGELPAALNIVISGRFIVLLPSERLTRLGDNAMLSLDSYIVGDSFGEAALIEDNELPASASVVATEAAQVLSISRDTFERVTTADGRIGSVVYRNLFGLQTRRLSSLCA